VLQEGVKDVKAVNAIIDGESVALDRNGMPLFEGLRSGSRGRECVIVFRAFDLLYLDGASVGELPGNKTSVLCRFGFG
jgi:ATP-dependent DNA ligase